MKNILHGSLVSAIFTLALVCPPVRAAIVVTTDYRDSAPAYAVAQDDLFQTHLKGLELEGDLFDRHMDINELVDGQFGDLGAGSTAGTAAVAAGGVLIFVLNLDESPEGYDLTALRSFAGWDSSGDGQEYTVEYATVDTPKDFQTLITVGPFNPGYTNNNSSTRVTLTDSEGMLMHRAAVIRITFTAFENGATYYREFDAIGAPASAATAQVPQLLNYQGRVVVGSSNFNGTGQFKFSLVDGGGKMTYWSNDGSGLGGEPPDTAVALPVVNGLYSVLLGDTALGNMLGIPAQVFTHADVRLRVWFNDGVNDFQLLSPDQRIAAVGYAMVAASVPDGAITAAKLAPGAVTVEGLADGAITAAKLDPATLAPYRTLAAPTVAGINGLNNQITVAAGAGVSIATSGNQLTISAAGTGWGLGGNAVGATGSFLGTTDNQPLDFKVNSIRGLRIYDPGDSNDTGSGSDGAPNLIGGAPGNTIAAGIVGSTIAGGGATNYGGTAYSNSITANFGFIGGGYSNVIQTGGAHSVIAGGYGNSATGATAFVAGGDSNTAGQASFAAGHRAKATHSGSFVWADATDANFSTTASNQLLIRASGGVGIGTNAPGAALEVAGQVKITGGTPGVGKVLMSDANGLASWKPLSEILFGQDYTQLIPEVIDNSADFELSGIMSTSGFSEKIVVISGPGWNVQRVPGFLNGRPNDSPGPNMETPFIFEYAGMFEDELQDFYDYLQIEPDDVRSGSLIFRKLNGEEKGRWNLYDMRLTAIENGSDGRKRYTLITRFGPNAHSDYQRDMYLDGHDISFNPATDSVEIEIEGVLGGVYPVVTVDEVNRTITMVFDYNESGGMYDWARYMAEGTDYKRNMSLITRINGTGDEISRRNYFGVIPIQYQQSSGFGQFEKLKEKVVLAFDYSQDG